MSKFLKRFVVASLLLASTVMSAKADTVWSVSGLFDTGTAFSGTITVNAAIGVVAWDLSTVNAGYTTGSGSSFESDNSGGAYQFGSEDGFFELDLVFATALSDPSFGASMPLIIGANSSGLVSSELDTTDVLNPTTIAVASGGAVSRVASTDVPEPASLAILGAGIAALGGALRRRASV